MSHAQPTHPPASPGVASHPQGANGKPKARDKAHDAAMALALLLTDWLHGDRHHQAELTKLALAMLDDLSGGPDVKEPDEAQTMALEAKGRLEGGMTAARPQDQPAMRQQQQQTAPPQAEHAAGPAPMTRAH